MEENKIETKKEEIQEPIGRYSEIEFQFARPLTAEQEEIFTTYFRDIKHSVMDRLLSSLNGTDRNPLKAWLKQNLQQHSPMIMGKYQFLYSTLQLQSEEGNQKDTDIFVVEDKDKATGKWTFRMDMSAFDVALFGDLKVPLIQRQALNLMNNKDKRIKEDFFRSRLPLMKLKNSECLIRARYYGDPPKTIIKETAQVKKGFTGFQLFMVAVILIVLYFLIGQISAVIR